MVAKYFGHNFTNNYHNIMIFGSKCMFMDTTNPYKMVLTTTTVPGVTIVQNGCQKWLPKAVFGNNFEIIDT